MIFGGLSAAGAIAGVSAATVKAVDDKKTAKSAQAEVERHNRVVESQLKAGFDLYLSKKCPRRLLPNVWSLPSKKLEPLSNFDLDTATRPIHNFRGMFIRDGLPPSVRGKECDIVNFDSNEGYGTHWVAYYKDGIGQQSPRTFLLKYRPIPALS